MIVEEVGSGSKGYDNYDKRVVVWPVRKRHAALTPPMFLWLGPLYLVATCLPCVDAYIQS